MDYRKFAIVGQRNLRKGGGIAENGEQEFLIYIWEDLDPSRLKYRFRAAIEDANCGSRMLVKENEILVTETMSDLNKRCVHLKKTDRGTWTYRTGVAVSFEGDSESNWVTSLAVWARGSVIFDSDATLDRILEHNKALQAAVHQPA